MLLRATDPNLVSGHHDLVGTVVTAAHPGNIESVFVAGKPVRTTVPADLAEALHTSAVRTRGLGREG